MVKYSLFIVGQTGTYMNSNSTRKYSNSTQSLFYLLHIKLLYKCHIILWITKEKETIATHELLAPHSDTVDTRHKITSWFFFTCTTFPHQVHLPRFRQEKKFTNWISIPIRRLSALLIALFLNKIISYLWTEIVV